MPTHNLHAPARRIRIPRLLALALALPFILSALPTTPAHADYRSADIQVQAGQSSAEVRPPDIMMETSYVRVDYTVSITNTSDVEGTTPAMVLRPNVPDGMSLRYVMASGPYWLNEAFTPKADGSIPLKGSGPLYPGATETFELSAYYAIDTAAITPQGWSDLDSCSPNDVSKGLSTQIDVRAASGVKAATYTTCTPVTRPGW